jgi:capsular exopolysaccharide synthesis family protein
VLKERTLELDLRQLMRIGRRWWWLLLLTTLLAAGSAWLAMDRQEPLYSSTVTLRVNPPVGSAGDLSALTLTQNLTETYRQMIVLDPVLQGVVEQLGLPYDVDELKSMATASAVADTQLLRLSISDTDPERAAIIANTVASQFIAYLGEQNTTQFVNTQQLLTDQLTGVTTQLTDVRAQIATLDTEANRENANIQGQIETLRLQETQLLQQQASLQNQSQSLGLGLATSQAQVSISEPATPPSTPYAPKVRTNTLLAAFVGLIIGVGAVALLEYLDNTVRAETDVTALTGATLLTAVAEIPKLRPGGQQVYTVTQPRSNASEAVRLLRASLEFAAAANPINSLAISSAGPGEGKSTVTANLGVVMAQAGFSTIIVDADLRKPTQHKIFNIPNTVGLTSLLTHPERSWREMATRIAVPNLSLIPSGPIPPNPADLLSLDRFANLLAQLERDADIVLIDTPPILAVSDPLLVGTKTDGMVLLGRSGTTRRDRLANAADALEKAGIRLVGIVLNQEHSRGAGYYYYYGDYGSAAQTPPAGQETAPPVPTAEKHPA